MGATKISLELWLTERAENCRRILKLKPEDADAWQEDADYFDAAVRAVNEREGLREALFDLFTEIRSRFAKSEDGYKDMTTELRKVMLKARKALGDSQ